MTWTYIPNFSLARDRLRFLIQDTDIEDQLVQDEEIALYTAGGAYEASTDLDAAIALVRAILRKLSRQAVRLTAGGTSVDLTKRVDAYRQTLADLIAQVATSASAVPYAGGISRSDVLAREDDTDRVPPFFSRTTGEPDQTIRAETQVWR